MSYDEAVAGADPFSIGPLDQIRQQLRDEIHEAARSESPEVAYALAGLPLRIARRARELGAISLMASMLSLYPEMYAIAARYQ